MEIGGHFFQVSSRSGFRSVFGLPKRVFTLGNDVIGTRVVIFCLQPHLSFAEKCRMH